MESVISSYKRRGLMCFHTKLKSCLCVKLKHRPLVKSEMQIRCVLSRVVGLRFHTWLKGSPCGQSEPTSIVDG